MEKEPNIDIREAEKRDLPRIIALMEALVITRSDAESLGASTLADYEEIFQRIQDDPNYHLFVVESDGRVIGSACLLIVPNLSHRGLPWALISRWTASAGLRASSVTRPCPLTR